MKKELVFLLILLLSFFCSFGQRQRNIVIAFYNCENLYYTQHEPGKGNADFTPEGKFHYTDKLYHEKLHNIAIVLKAMADEASASPALIGLVDVENEQVLKDLVNEPELKANNYRYLLYDRPYKNGLNIALLYLPAAFTPLASYLIGVNYNKEAVPDMLYVKGLLLNDTVHVLVNHWTSARTGEKESEQKRLASAKTCRNKIDSIFKIMPASNIIIMGDLSSNPTDSVISSVLNARAEKSAPSSAALYNPWVNIYKSGRGSLEYLDHWDLYDQIIFSAPFLPLKASLHFERASIFKKDFMVDHNKRFLGYPHSSFAGTQWINGYSDHFPVMLYLSAY